ncbi:Alanine racemase [Planococcus massiliensis]|uniref:Alanine racemase n=1 Tax=Planococcus massiliensis TaxID=1499687 RepID=A0A098EQB8_9BACL|nr:alanine racemase [Planococcus massiliensis]CEG23975.1 Alanine racemase [Planococcus massiliensis]
MVNYRPTKAIIDLAAIEKNLEVFKKQAGKAEVIAVVKADAYGHGVVEVSQRAIASGIRFLAVATPDEALFLRKQGIDTRLLVLGATPEAFIPVAQQEEITLAAISLAWLEMASKAANPKLRPLKIHLKIDSGMRRVGVFPEDTEQAINFIRQNHFSFDGLFTHFATADEESGALFQQQVKEMRAVIASVSDPSVMIHVSNSAAAIMHPDLAYDGVRIGISLYGIAPSAYVENQMAIGLTPAMSLETEIVHVKKVKAGEALSYGATYRAKEDEWIATLPIGYADGMLRGLQGQEVLVRGMRMPVVGRICMDQCMVKLTEEFPIGEKVTLIGKQGNEQIRMEEWAEKLDTIPYEVPCILTKRVPRIYC